MKRCIAFCLALGAALSLTACGGGDTEGGLLCEASGIRPDTVLLSVDGRDVSAQRYLYWLAYACDYIADYYDSGEGIQWGDTVSGQSLEDYAKDQALQNAALYATVETWAEDYGCTLTDEDRTAMDREWAARAAQYGGEEAYLAVLARMGLDRAEAEAISGDYYLYEHLYDLYCTEGSELAPAEHDLETFAQEQGYLTVDHIWLSTAAVDPADAEAVAACRAKAEEAFSKLNGSADPAHDFAVLAATYSDETDRDQHPSGYTFTVGDGTLPAACEEAAQALEEAFRAVKGTVVLLLDCCQSGGFIGENGISQLFSASKYIVLTSASSDQDSYRISYDGSDNEYAMATMFARSLSEGLGWDMVRDRTCSLKADLDHDRVVTIQELYLYTKRRVMYYLRSADGTKRQDVQLFPQGANLTIFQK